MLTCPAWRRVAVGVVVCVCAATVPRAVTASPVSSLSGNVYLEANGDNVCDASDWGVKGAKVTLTKSGDASFLVSILTDKTGSYLFDGPSPTDHSGLQPGSYGITLAPYTATNSATNVGQLLDLTTGAAIVPADLGVVAANGNAISGINVLANTEGVGYDFGKAEYPLELVSMKMVLASSDPATHSTIPTPEPGTLMLLVFGGIGCAALGLIRRRSR